MGKLTVANLFHTVRSQGDPNGRTPHSPRLLGEKLWRLTAEAESAESLLSVSELLGAVRQVFDAHGDRLISAASGTGWRRCPRDGRLLRFDPEHLDRRVAGDESAAVQGALADERLAAPDAVLPSEPAKSALLKALGALQARDALGDPDWVVVFVNANTASAPLPAVQVERLGRSSRMLIVCCEQEGDGEFDRDVASPAAAVLEQLAREPDLTFLGPIGGLEKEGLVAVLDALKSLEQPAVLHLRLKGEPKRSGGETRRPRLDSPPTEAARPEDNARDANSGRNGSSKVESPPGSSGELAAEQTARLARDDRRIFVMNLMGDADWQAFAEEFPDRYLEAPAGDVDAIDWCAGLADGGCRPFVVVGEASLLHCAGRVADEIGDPQRSVTFVVSSADRDAIERDGSGGLCLPGEIAVMVPSDAAELAAMLGGAANYDGPAAIWLPETLPERLPQNPASEPASGAEFAFGRAAHLRSGTDVALLAIGAGASIACEAADQLAALGVSAAVLNLRFARPLDESAIRETVRGTRAVAIVDESLSRVAAGAALDILASLEGDRPAAVFGSSALRGRRRPSDPHYRCDSAALPDDCLARQCIKLLETAPPLDSDLFQEALPAQALEAANLAHTPQDERRQILAREFSPTAAGWLREYEEVGERGLYLWRWCLHGVGLTTLPCVSEELREHACDTKFLSGMLNVLLDDVSDRKRNGDLLDELLKVTGGCAGDFARFSAADRKYAELTSRLWNVFWERVRTYPNYATYKDLLQYDLTQLFNTVRYSHLVNDNLFLLNLTEHDNYSPQGMGLMSFSTVDLMCTDRFPRHELAALREAVWHAQWMARIGNLITTWQREIGDGDYSSGVFARAVGLRDLTIEQLRSGNAEEIEAGVRRGEHEAHFLRRWNYHRERLRAMRPCIQSFDLNLVVEGLERLLLTELGSRGRK